MCPRKLHFTAAVGPFGLWGAGGGGGGRAGQSFLESSVLYGSHTLENPRLVSFEGAPEQVER